MIPASASAMSAEGAEALAVEAQQVEEKPQAGAVVQALNALFLFFFAPCKRSDPCGTPFTVRQCINLHKGFVWIVYLIMINHYTNGSFQLTGTSYGPAATVLLCCHGMYGFAWIYKDVHFPDPSWRAEMTVMGFILVFIFPLGTYYLPMYCLLSGQCLGGKFANGDELWIVGAGLLCFLIGFFYHFCADLQKYFVLKHQRPRGLITDGMFAHCRNPNYFGEILLYAGYGILSCSWMTIPIFAIVWLLVFVPNMLKKEASMSRYPQWKDWVSRSGFVIPWFPPLVRDLLVYGLNRHGIPEDV